MKNTNIFKFLSISLLMCPLFSSAMEVEYPPINAQVQVYFAPENRKEMTDQLFSLIDNAKQAVYIAMYWITNDSILDKIIDAKRRNVTVEIFLDSSSPNLMTYIEKLLKNNITPVI